MVFPIPGSPSISTTLGSLHSSCDRNASVIGTIFFVLLARSFFFSTIFSLVKTLESCSCSSSSHQGKGHSTAPLYFRLMSSTNFCGKTGKTKDNYCLVKVNHLLHHTEVKSKYVPLTQNKQVTSDYVLIRKFFKRRLQNNEVNEIVRLKTSVSI